MLCLYNCDENLRKPLSLCELAGILALKVVAFQVLEYWHKLSSVSGSSPDNIVLLSLRASHVVWPTHARTRQSHQWTGPPPTRCDLFYTHTHKPRGLPSLS